MFTNLEIVPLDTLGFNRSSIKKINFDCGNQSLNDYLKKYAIINDKSGVAKVFIAVQKGNQNIVCYYTSSASVISTQAISDELRGNFPRKRVGA